ncbi:MAG TPA: spermidine/putrescine ABC transporter substrate-binding protein [Anaerolineales bacterium]|nr:spermidine/putrescine ABC transporter substrate-binding protein [Anaerolineales bacterium]HNH26359.1 spermidine/putrescine ABC transporter substrate-binding protein [Anaerolineales bacterium]
MHKNRFASMFLVFAIVSGMLAACAPSAPVVTSKELNLYAFSEYVPADLLSSFEKETGIKVNYEAYSSNEEMLAGLDANPDKYDLLIPSDYTVEGLIQKKALRPLDLKLIPNYSNIDPAFLSPYFDPGGDTGGRRPYATDNDKYSLPYQWGTTGIAYDTTKVDQPITKWEDLWRPELAGHIVVLDDARELMGAALLSLGYDKNTTDPKRLEEARDKLKKLAPGILAYDSDAPEKYLISGEAWVGVVFNGNAALAMRQNQNIQYVFPEEGATIWFDNFVIPVNALHADAAEAFINFSLAPENSALITRDFPYSSPNTAALDYLAKNDASLYEQYRSNNASNPPPDALANARLAKNLSADASDLYTQFWSEVKNTK